MKKQNKKSKLAPPREAKSIKLPSLEDKSEKQKSAAPAPLNPAERIGYAVVGLGNLSLTEILPAFGQCKYSKPVALVSGEMDKARMIADQYGIDQNNIYSYDDYDAIADNEQIKVVYIALPNNLHVEYTVRGAVAGKHVLCEKPMANSVDECKEMIAACKKANRKLMIGYRIQYEPNNRQIMKWIRDEEYGKVKIIESYNGQNMSKDSGGKSRLKKNLAGGGALVDIGIYCLNTIRFLTGEEPTSILATTHSTPNDERFKEVEESVLFQMIFPSGILANCASSYGAHHSRRYRCYTDNGTWMGMDLAFDYKGLHMEVSYADEKMERTEHPYIGEKNHFALEMDHLALCIMDNAEPYTPGEEGMQDQKIMDAIYESAKEERVVKLKEVKGKDAFRGTPPADE